MEVKKSDPEVALTILKDYEKTSSLLNYIIELKSDEILQGS